MAEQNHFKIQNLKITSNETSKFRLGKKNQKKKLQIQHTKAHVHVLNRKQRQTTLSIQQVTFFIAKNSGL